MQKKCFTIQSDKGSKYKIVVDYNQNGNPEIYIGGSKHYCMSISGFILDVKSGDKCHNLHIRNVNFSYKASDMMKALLYFIQRKQKEIRYIIDNKCEITFTDTSENQFCGNLSSYYLAFDQKTWYEKDFGAYLINNIKNKLTPSEKHKLQIPQIYMIYNGVFDVVNMYKDQKKIFEDEIIYIEIKNIFMNYLNIHTRRDIIDKVLILYNNSKNFKELFTKIKNTFSNKCKELNLTLWLDEFIKFTLNFKFLKNQVWKIDCDKNLGDETYEINNCEHLPDKYLSVNQTGNGKKKKLTERQMESYKNPNWIGWVDMNINEYSKKDRLFLKNCSTNP